MQLIKILVLILISLTISIKANSNEYFQDLLKDGSKIIFIRHAYAPGTGDPKNFNIKDCSTQRNLNKKGINESKKIGAFFLKNKIEIHEVLSSEWCRCKDTAFYAFKNYQKKSFLNSFYDEKFVDNKTNQIIELKKYIKKWNKKKNLVLITHYVVISEVLKIGVSPAEIIISDKNFNVLGRHIIKEN
ncbi:histidine phosphatase family protein [Candidatus Pelagibacter sp.]|nr:histidine phosphatase family protein [Candidatus Pelagibacter sp.]